MIVNTRLSTEQVMGEGLEVDSGATCHVTNNSNHLTSNKETSQVITVGNGNKVNVNLIGDLAIQFNEVAVKLTEVAYVPKFARNILSLRKSIDGGCSITTPSKSELIISAPNNKQLVAKRHNDNLYYLKGARFDDELVKELVFEARNKVLSTVQRRITLSDAHQMFGHADSRSVMKSVKQLGWQLSDNTMDPCGPCALSKAQA
jgi:hypothetical protein